ncbi:thiamine phosphate synthase [bacterium]|nr:thiamine phosphate synthase [bacterium]
MDRAAPVAQSLADQGCNMIQVRAKNLPANRFFHFVKQVLRSVGPECQIIVNDRLDVALAAGAAGVHLGGSDLPLTAARAVAGRGFILGATCRDPECARQALRQGADYLGVGAVFPTGSKSDTRLIGLEGLAAVAHAVSLPVYAIAGITLDNAASTVAAGAYGCAGISALSEAENPAAAFLALERALDRAAANINP